MTKIVGMNDLKNDQNPQNQGSATSPEGGNSENPFISSGPVKDPKDEGFWEMVHVNFFPSLKWYSFSVILSYILILMFIIYASVDGLKKELITVDFIPTNSKGTFGKLFVCDYPSIRQNFHFWKLVTSMFFHRNAMHLFSSIVSLLIWASMFEKLIKTWKLVLYFFVGGIIGNIFALCILRGQTELIGSTVGVFGIFGGVFGYLIFNWRNMEQVKSRVIWLLLILFIFLFSLIFSDFESLIPNLTGFVCGIFIGFCMSDKYLAKNTIDMGMTDYELVFFYIGISLLVTIVIISFCVIYLTASPGIKNSTVKEIGRTLV